MNPVKFLGVAAAMAELSKDPSTRVGCVIVDDDGNILATGYNGFPRGVIDYPSRYEEKAVKYKLVSHAESNAIAQAARNGNRLLGSTLVVTALYPCSSCAKQIIQAGIKRVLAPPMDDASQTWRDEMEWSMLMFDEAGVEVVTY